MASHCVIGGGSLRNATALAGMPGRSLSVPSCHSPLTTRHSPLTLPGGPIPFRDSTTDRPLYPLPGGRSSPRALVGPDRRRAGLAVRRDGSAAVHPRADPARSRTCCRAWPRRGCRHMQAGPRVCSSRAGRPGACSSVCSATAGGEHHNDPDDRGVLAVHGVVRSARWWPEFAVYRFLCGTGIGGEYAAGVGSWWRRPCRPAPGRSPWGCFRPSPRWVRSSARASVWRSVRRRIIGRIAGWRCLFGFGAIPTPAGRSDPDGTPRARAVAVRGDRARSRSPDLGRSRAASAMRLGDLRAIFGDLLWRRRTLVGHDPGDRRPDRPLGDRLWSRPSWSGEPACPAQ